jgi:hypothetical protein
MRFAHRLGLLVLALAASVALAGAQATTGSIQGVVRDNQDALVPGATVTVRHVQTNVSRTLVTDGTGAYRFLNMPVGEYEMTVELPGFARYVRQGLTLALNQVAVVDVQLQPAAVTETMKRFEFGLRRQVDAAGSQPVLSGNDEV